jgi:hypothetical protein
MTLLVPRAGERFKTRLGNSNAPRSWVGRRGLPMFLLPLRPSEGDGFAQARGWRAEEAHALDYARAVQFLPDEPRLLRAVDSIGLELLPRPGAGTLWARLPRINDGRALAGSASQDGIQAGIMLAGAVFRPHLERSPWVRSNVAVATDVRVQRWLAQAVKHPSVERDGLSSNRHPALPSWLARDLFRKPVPTLESSPRPGPIGITR